jgi:hypothetical protein
MGRSLGLVFVLGMVIGAATSSCGGSGSGSSGGNACLTCGGKMCPSETSACDASSGCKTLRSCELGCQVGDDTCKNACVAKVASDSTAVVAGANLLECATSMCPTECNPAATGTAGTNGGTGSAGTTGHAGTTGTTGHAGTNGGTGSAGTSGQSPGNCYDTALWSTGCAVDTEPPFRTCDASNITQCNNGCYIMGSCNDYQQYKAGVLGDLSSCLNYCAFVNHTGASGATCANASGMLYACDLAGDVPCDDTNAVDVCQNQCVLSSSCAVLTDNIVNLNDNAFSSCLDACSSTTGSTFTVAAGGYVTSGTWMGYAWTGKDSTSTTSILPTDFSTLAAGGSLCVSGTVAGTADYSAVAILGLDINQAMGGAGGAGGSSGSGPPPSTWAPTGTGVVYSITNNGTSPLRIQIQAAGGDTDPTKRWCAPVGASSGVISWGTFNTACWDGSGSNYNGATPLQSIMVLVPGDLSPVGFNFCLNSIAPR